MSDRLPIVVAVLAAGASRRLGRLKQLVKLPDGEALIRRQCRVALDGAVGPVMVVLGCRAEACAAALDGMGVATRVNSKWEEGLASSIRCAVRAALDGGAAGLLILHGDQYRVTSEDLRSLCAAWQQRGETKA